MRVLSGLTPARLTVGGVLSLVLIGGAAAAQPAHAGGSPPPRPSASYPASLAPDGAAGQLTEATLRQAAQTCAVHAAAAGWANNGSFGGSLVTAVAVCVAESGGQANVYYCDGNGTIGHYPPVNCPGGSYDRGLWQLNSKYQPDVSDSCAFDPQCNANNAYRISADGTSFAPWAVYGSDIYVRYLGPAQRAVRSLSTGALASAEYGVCVTQSSGSAGATAVVGKCGQGATAQQWTLASGAIRNGSLCLAVGPGSRHPSVVVATCSGSAGQTWAPSGLGQLKNAQAGKCLRDPHGSTAAGAPLDLANCAISRPQTWWLP
jgi:Lysozyme like domain/Ricin-type beta-trefoil lectin domain